MLASAITVCRLDAALVARHLLYGLRLHRPDHRCELMPADCIPLGPVGPTVRILGLLAVNFLTEYPANREAASGPRPSKILMYFDHTESETWPTRTSKYSTTHNSRKTKTSVVAVNIASQRLGVTTFCAMVFAPIVSSPQIRDNAKVQAGSV